jgi:hypothetical protein
MIRITDPSARGLFGKLIHPGPTIAPGDREPLPNEPNCRLDQKSFQKNG